MKKILTIGLLLSIFSCVQPTNQRADYGSSGSGTNTGSGWPSNNNGSGWNNGDSGNTGSTGGEQTSNGDGYGDGNEEGVSDGGQTINFYTIEGIAIHGTEGRTLSGPIWSTTMLGSGDQAIMYSNSRFNIRVRPRSAPTRGSSDSEGVTCNYVANPYKKLRVKLCLRKAGATCDYTKTVTFGDIAVDEVSKVKEFTNLPVTSEPLIIDILSVQWDYACQNYLDQGYSSDDPQLDGYCPMGNIWKTSCAAFDIQFSTDITKDFPVTAPRM